MGNEELPPGVARDGDVLVLKSAGVSWRAFGCRARFDSRGIDVRNWWRRRTIRWDEVAHLDAVYATFWPRNRPFQRYRANVHLVVRLRSGESVSVRASYRYLALTAHYPLEPTVNEIEARWLPGGVIWAEEVAPDRPWTFFDRVRPGTLVLALVVLAIVLFVFLALVDLSAP